MIWPRSPVARMTPASNEQDGDRDDLNPNQQPQRSIIAPRKVSENSEEPRPERNSDLHDGRDHGKNCPVGRGPEFFLG